MSLYREQYIERLLQAYTEECLLAPMCKRVENGIFGKPKIDL
jgi:hypothetical protein